MGEIIMINALLLLSLLSLPQEQPSRPLIDLEAPVVALRPSGLFLPFVVDAVESEPILARLEVSQ